MLIVKFSDGELVQGGGWNSLPNKPIKKVAMIIENKKIIMQDYESYNHLQEHVYIASGPSDKGDFLRAIYLMGSKENKVHVIKINLMNGEVTEEKREMGEEYNGRPSTGWKKGIPDLNPQYYIG